MSSKKPVIHGRDHLPGGADPIPAVPSGFSGLPFAVASRFSQSIADDTATAITLTTSSGTADWATSDSSIFDLNSGGLAILTDGIYLFYAWAHLLISAAPTGTSPTAWVELNSDFIEGTTIGTASWFKNSGATTYIARPKYVGFWTASAGQGEIPATENLVLYQRSGGTVTGVACGVQVLQISPTALIF